MFDLLNLLLDATEQYFVIGALVFFRIGAVTAFIPGFGEQFLPGRIRLGIAVALTFLAVPAIGTEGLPDQVTFMSFAGLALTEAAVGLLIGVALRLIVMALQFAGSIAAQTTALAQMAGPGITPDPMPAIANTLLMAGLTLAMILGLHIKAVLAIVASYQVLGFGASLPAGDLTSFGIAQGRAAFALAFSMAAPFVIAAFLYNVALGVINRAMPQLMVAFVGAPAITAVTLLLLLLTSPLILTVWHAALDSRLAAPLEIP